MTNYDYHLVGSGERASITIVADGQMHVANSDSHPNIRDIIESAINGDPDVLDLFDPRRGIERKFERLGQTGRVTIKGDDIFLDGDPAPPAIANAILQHYDEGLDFSALVAFLEKLANNPSRRSVEQLYPWLDANRLGVDGDDGDDLEGFTITEDGDLIAYKGVRTTEDGNYVSVNQGRAIVNGEEFVGPIPNGIGDIVEMPRSEVMDDSAVGCAQGLHAGTYAYARGWAQGALLEVRIDPRDVVSVPTDCGAQKLRVCRYTVEDIIDAPHTSPVRGYEREAFDPYAWGDDEDDYDSEFDGFDVGDRVEIVDDIGGVYPESVGVYGTVKGIDGTFSAEYPYVVAGDNGVVYRCSQDELDLA